MSEKNQQKDKHEKYCLKNIYSWKFDPFCHLHLDCKFKAMGWVELCNHQQFFFIYNLK